jgi:hypothetical protein
MPARSGAFGWTTLGTANGWAIPIGSDTMIAWIKPALGMQ